MTPAPHNPEQDLSQTLARQADRFVEAGGAPLELDQVLSRAGEIRRGRRMRATMVMAAVVLAVAVPVGITTLGQNDPTRPPVQPAATTTPDRSNVELGEYKDGAAPKTGYVDGDKLIYNGTERSIGDGQVSYLARMDGGFLIGQSDNSGNLTARFMRDQGTTTEPRTLDGGFAVSPQGLFGAFVGTDGTVVVAEGGSTFTEIGHLPTGKGISYSAVAVSDSACNTAESCSVWAVDNGEKSTLWEVSPGTAPAKSKLTGLIAVDTHGNSVRKISYDDQEGATSAFFDIDGNQVWKSSEYFPKSFSPDGKHLIAGPAYGDGLADLQLTILDSATGKPTLDLKSAMGEVEGSVVSVFEVVWEDDQHVLAVVAEGTRFAVLRVGLDGSREYAVAPKQVADSFDAAPFRLG